MKSGSGSNDPFADDDDPDEDDGVELDEGQRSEERSHSRDQLPWIYRRESVQDGRVKTVQLHLQDDAARDDREERAQLQQRSSEDLKKADFREAVFLAGLAHMNDAIETLEEWGYDFG
jgi:hypothetical protein